MANVHLSEADIKRLHRFGRPVYPLSFDEWMVLSQIWLKAAEDPTFFNLAYDNNRMCLDRCADAMGLRTI